MRVKGVQQTGQSGRPSGDVVALSSLNGIFGSAIDRGAEVAGAGVVVAEPVGVAVEVEDDGAVEEPGEQGGRDGGVAEDLAPAGDAAVGRQDDRGLEVALGD